MNYFIIFLMTIMLIKFMILNFFYSNEFEGMFANLLVSDYLKDSPDEYNFLNNYYLENYKDLTTGLLFG